MKIKLIVLLIAFGVFLSFAFCSNTIYAELQDIGVKITSPSAGQKVPVGELTIFGTSTDNETTDCQVQVDVNDIKPFQNATATGPMMKNDYSTWIFSYTKDYHLIGEGANELTAKISCLYGPVSLTKYYTVNVIGVNREQEQ
ncbi:MAG: hypothetical protein M3250_01645 [Thermoproteota archaeon]|jgi:hypothetical protein|nr:hypothetical protein [Thermoproteota archaeon]